MNNRESGIDRVARLGGVVGVALRNGDRPLAVVARLDRLRAAGVAVELELFRGLTHDFIKMGRMLPEAAQAQQAIADALRKAFE